MFSAHSLNHIDSWLGLSGRNNHGFLCIVDFFLIAKVQLITILVGTGKLQSLAYILSF
jgi:hypothetical protein